MSMITATELVSISIVLSDKMQMEMGRGGWVEDGGGLGQCRAPRARWARK